MVNLNKIMKRRKALYLAYDQGLEHGPTDFNDKNVDPKYILGIARKGRYNGVILHKGIVEKYFKEIKVPLILKLNGKTRLVKGDPLSTQLSTVKEAVKFKAVAVGYTIYLGSEHEGKMLKEFEEIQREAHKKNLPVIAWIYPRGKSIKKYDGKMMAYAARVGLEIGADVIKMKYNGNKKDLEWAVESAGKTKIVIAGGVKKDENILYKQTKDIMCSGAVGLAIGRNVWQNKNPLEVTKKIKRIIWK